MFIHADESACVRVIVSGPQVVKPCRLIEGFPRVPVADVAARVRIVLNPKRIEVQHLQRLALMVGHQACAALGIGVQVLCLPVAALAQLQPHPIRRMHMHRLLPRPTVRSRSLQHDLAVGPRGVQQVLRLFCLPALLLRAADPSPLCVVAVLDRDAAVAGLGEAVVTAPAVGDGLAGCLLLYKVAPPVIPVADGAAGRGFSRELVQSVVAVGGDHRGRAAPGLALLHTVANTIVLIAGGRIGNSTA